MLLFIHAEIKVKMGCAVPVFGQMPLAKVENIPMAKENFLIMSPLLWDFKEFSPKYSLAKRKFPKKKTII